MVKMRVGEGIFGGVDYEWKIEGLDDIWDFLLELADKLDESVDVKSIECVGETSLDFPTDEYRRFKSVEEFKSGADEAKEFTDDARFYVDMGGESFCLGVYGNEPKHEVIISCSSDKEPICKAVDKLIRKWFG